MTIAFKARVDDPTIASYRYRVLTPIAALGELGHEVELFTPQRSDAYDTVVFSKAYKTEDRRLAGRLAKAGKRVILDLCDDHFYNPFRLPKYQQARDDLLQMIAAVDRVICSTPVLAEAVRRAARLDYLPAVAPDAYEPAGLQPRAPTPLGEPARLLWFGRSSSPNAPAGMSDVLLVRQQLAEAHAKRPFVLTVCSDDRSKFEETLSGLQVPVEFSEWTPERFKAELARADAVIIPLSDNPFVAAKTHNRLTLALSAGVPVVADRLDSYEEFGGFCYLGDWEGGLEAVLLRPEEARARAQPAGEYLELHWSAQAVAPAWERALGLPEGLPQPAAATSDRPQAGPRPVEPSPTGEALDWLRQDGRNERPWLLAGDDADPVQVNRARSEGFLILSIGRGFTRFRSDAAFVPDVETAQEASEPLTARAGAVIMPRFPHAGGWASRRPLQGWRAEVPALDQLAAAGRLLAMDLWTGSAEGVAGEFEGEEAPLRLLVLAGVKMARHLGVRGRRPSVSGFEATAPLMSRGGSGVAALRRSSGVSYGPYGYPVPARIFVGSDDEQLMGARLLDYSIQKYSTMDAVVEVLDFRDTPVPADPRNRSRTGFSFCRFDIPRLCGFEGRGVYVDADMQVFTDITDLWTLPLEDADILYALSHPSQGRTPQTSVMLLNCAALRWDVADIVAGLDQGRYGYKDLMQRMCIHPGDRVKPLLPYWWNSLERFEPGRTSLIHYTDMPTQPWVSHDNKNGGLWYSTFAEALETGFISEEEVNDAIARGHVSPELPAWIGRARETVDEDAASWWVAPYHRYSRVDSGLEGAVTLTSKRRLRGWAYQPSAPEAAVRLGAYDGEQMLFAFDADQEAEILKRHGKGSGRHAFDVTVPEEVWTSNVQALSVRAIEPAVELAGSPVELVR